MAFVLPILEAGIAGASVYVLNHLKPRDLLRAVKDLLPAGEPSNDEDGQVVCGVL